MDLFSFIPLIIGVGFMVVGIKKWQAGRWFQKHGVRTTGTVIESVRKRSRGSKYYVYTPVIYFETPDGKPFSRKMDYGDSMESYPKGAEVDIIYDPENPKDFDFDGVNHQTIIPLLVILIGLVITTLFMLELYGMVDLWSDVESE